MNIKEIIEKLITRINKYIYIGREEEEEEERERERESDILLMLIKKLYLKNANIMCHLSLTLSVLFTIFGQ